MSPRWRRLLLLTSLCCLTTLLASLHSSSTPAVKLSLPYLRSFCKSNNTNWIAMTGAQLDSFGARAFHSDIACVHVTREHSRPFKHGTLFPFLAKDPLLDSGQPGVG